MLPNLLHLGHLTFPTFGVLAAVGLVLALLLSERTAAWLSLPPERVWNAGLFAVLAAFVLSRALLVATNFASFRRYPILLLMVPSLTASGLLLTAGFTLVYLRWRRLPLLRTLDAWAAPATLLWAFLALGHFAEGSDPGLPAPRFGLPALRGSSLRTYPVPLLACAAALLLTALLLRRMRRGGRPGVGSTLAMALFGAGLAQFLLTFLRQPYPYLPPFTSVLDPIQWLALGMIAAGGVLWAASPPFRSPAPEPAHAL